MLRHVLTLFLCIAFALPLASCRGMGMNHFNSGSYWTTEDAEDHAESSWWGRFWGRKREGHESEAWKDYYDNAAEEVPRYENCGYWGSNWKNCRTMQAPTMAPNCDFYGNCTASKTSLGW